MNNTNQNFTTTNVKYLRESLNIKQSKMAKDLKIDQSTITKWENGQRNITIDWAIKLANYFDVAFGDFVATDLSKEKAKFDSSLDQKLIKSFKELSDSDKELLISVVDKIKKN